jgi:hypothetical protein
LKQLFLRAVIIAAVLLLGVRSVLGQSALSWTPWENGDVASLIPEPVSDECHDPNDRPSQLLPEPAPLLLCLATIPVLLSWNRDRSAATAGRSKPCPQHRLARRAHTR